MPDPNLKTAGTLRARASKSLAAMRTHVMRADALATHAAKQAIDCRRGAELADRTRHRWAR